MCKQSYKTTDNEKVVISIDIGTTSISWVVIDMLNKNVYESSSISPDRNLYDVQHGIMQSVAVITESTLKILKTLQSKYFNIAAVALTGQMHGIVYVDANGKNVSELYTWQNKKGEEMFNDTKTYCQYLSQFTKQALSSGFGAVTHFYLQTNHLINSQAKKFCTIMDYIAMYITQRTEPLTHISNAASFGFFDIDSNDFEFDELNKAGIDTSFFPKISQTIDFVGYYDGIPVLVAIGDNQASFCGATNNDINGILVNIGTGSQISVLMQKNNCKPDNLEVRPYDNKSIIAGYSALCGGYAYGLWEKFVREIIYLYSGDNSEQYQLLHKLLTNNNIKKSDLTAHTTFSGTRKNPELKGSILNITPQNFTPEAFTYSILEGITDELYNNFADNTLLCNKTLYVSGNAVRKNQLLLQIIENKFSQKAHLSQCSEEAAYGGAIFACGLLK